MNKNNKKRKPFWELGLNPITMQEPVRYKNEQETTDKYINPFPIDKDIYIPPLTNKPYNL